MNENPRLEAAGKAVKVTLYEDRAEVVRRARARLAPGPQWVAVTGVTPFVDDRSAQAKCLAEAVRVLAVRVRRRVTQQTDLGQEEIARLEEEERLARAGVQQADRGCERTSAEVERIRGLVEEWRRALAQVPQGARAEAIAGWRESYDRLAVGLGAAGAAALEARVAQEEAREALARAQARLAQARVTRPRSEASVEVQLDAPAAAEVELEVSYRSPCALWRPEHLARLVTEGDEARKGTLELITFATVWQRTGESWEGVEACFSTARPARVAVPPLLSADVLATRKKSEEERKTIQIEARDQAIATAGLAHGTRAAEEMPGVDDGGLPLSFTADGPVTLPSDGQPFRVEIHRLRLEAAVARVLLPERSAVAHCRATATLADSVPLLAGPVRVARGAGLVGRARTDFVAPGEPFALGFGPDDALRVRRSTQVRREQTPLIGTQKVEHTVRLFLSNLSDAPRAVELTERIPVSEIEDVEVGLLEAKGFRNEGADGLLKAELEIAPRETRTLEVRYEIRAKANVQLPL